MSLLSVAMFNEHVSVLRTVTSEDWSEFVLVGDDTRTPLLVATILHAAGKLASSSHFRCESWTRLIDNRKYDRPNRRSQRCDTTSSRDGGKTVQVFYGKSNDVTLYCIERLLQKTYELFAKCTSISNPHFKTVFFN